MDSKYEEPEEWVTVTNTKKVKQAERRAKKVQAEKAEAALAERRATKAARKGGPITKSMMQEVIELSLKKAPTAKNRGRSRTRRKTNKDNRDNPKNESEMCELIASILRSVPGNNMEIAAIGNAVQARTGHAWNKSYKNKYSSLGKFLGRNQDSFTVVGQDVHLSAVLDAIRSKCKRGGAKLSMCPLLLISVVCT
jgi:hypothetical protein